MSAITGKIVADAASAVLGDVTRQKWGDAEHIRAVNAAVDAVAGARPDALINDTTLARITVDPIEALANTVSLDSKWTAALAQFSAHYLCLYHATLPEMGARAETHLQEFQRMVSQ